MTEIAPSIDLKLHGRLQDRSTRQRFFVAESSSLLASQLIKLRKRRKLNQAQVAEAAHTQQPAISRMERADNQSWSFSALRRIAEALDARIRVIIEPSEDVLEEYEGGVDEARVNAVDGPQEAAQAQRVDTQSDVGASLAPLDNLNVGYNWFSMPAHTGAPLMSAYLTAGTGAPSNSWVGGSFPGPLVPASQLAAKEQELKEAKSHLQKVLSASLSGSVGFSQRGQDVQGQPYSTDVLRGGSLQEILGQNVPLPPVEKSSEQTGVAT